MPKPALRQRTQAVPNGSVDDDDEDLPLAILQKAKRQSIVIPASSKPARVVSFHKDASAPRPPAQRQSSLPPGPSMTRYRDSMIANRPGDRRSTLIEAHRPVSLALSGYAAEELQRLQSEVNVLRKQQREAEVMKREFEALKAAESRRSQIGEVINWSTLKAKEDEEAYKRKVRFYLRRLHVLNSACRRNESDGRTIAGGRLMPTI